jgi:hypothetical protein
MNAHKRKSIDEPVETIVLDELPLMETVEFRRFANLESEPIDDGDDEGSSD